MDPTSNRRRTLAIASAFVAISLAYLATTSGSSAARRSCARPSPRGQHDLAVGGGHHHAAVGFAVLDLRSAVWHRKPQPRHRAPPEARPLPRTTRR